MRDPQYLPKYLLVGVSDQGRDFWRIQRASDLAICGMDMTETTDDGVDILRPPRRREWADVGQASLYMARLEDGTAGTGDDLPVKWLPSIPFFTPLDGPSVDGPL